MASIPIIGARKPSSKSEEAPNRIVVVFPDDHSIDGVQLTAVGITPEQIFIATMHLQRVAMMTLARRDALAQQAEAEAMAVRENLAREKGN